MTKRIRIGLLGCGVVGSGVVNALQQNGQWIAEQTGVELEITRIAVRDLARTRVPAVRREWLCGDWQQVCFATDVDVVVEVMGGLHPAFEAISAALTTGKHVVTANKALLAARVDDLQQIAEENGRILMYEASVLGGVPVLHGLTTYFQANRIQRIRGIVNGTCNFILTKMAESGCDFAEALEEAQRLGYAEADPVQDIESFDAMYKLEILIRQAFRARIAHGSIERMDILCVEACDIDFARQLGCRIQQVASAALAGSQIVASVGPALVPGGNPLASIRGVDNALCVDADIVGRLVFSGPGAGAFPTASAVVEDLLKVIDGLPGRNPQMPVHQVIGAEAEAYFLRRRSRRPQTKLGPLLDGISPACGTRVGAYVQSPDGDAEGWVLYGTRATLAELATRFVQFDGASIACYPFTEIPAALAETSVHRITAPKAPA